MSFQPLTTAEIATGEPVSNETATKIKDNFDFLNERVDDIENSNSTVYPAIVLELKGAYGEPGDYVIPAIGAIKTTQNFNITVTGVRLIVDKAGVSGTTEIDIKYKRGAGAYTSILNTKPSVAFSEGDDATSNNAVLNPAQVNLRAGDIIRLDVTNAQARASNLLVRIDYVKT